MAKMKAGAGHQDIDEMTKTQVKAYYKEICDFYLENGWRDTLSHYALSPKQAKEITAKVRAKKDKEEAAAKAKRKKSKAAKGKASTKKAKPAAKKKSTKKLQTKAAPKAKTRRSKAPKIKSDLEPAEVLDFLLAYRNGSGGSHGNGQPVLLDDVIIELTTQVRAA